MKKIILSLLLLVATAAPALTSEEVVADIKRKAAEQHPGNYSLQEFVVKREIAALNEIGAKNFPGCEPVIDDIIDRAMAGNDSYALSLFVIKRECEAYKRLQ